MYKIVLLSLLSTLSLCAPWEEQQGGQVVHASDWETIKSVPVEPERDPKGLMSGMVSRLGDFWTWDRDVVKEGIFKNENIMIHVGQNLFNFVFSTLAWWTVSQIYSSTAGLPGLPREARSVTLSQAADEVLGAIREFEHRHK